MIRRVLGRINLPARGAKLARAAYGKAYPAFVEHARDLSRESFGNLVFDTTSPLSRWRGQTHLTKEPATIAWIESFAPGAVFYDIGANIGVYSLYAASRRGAAVFAFEPSPFNFAVLSRNVMLNGLSDRVSAFCAALSDKTVLDRLHISSLQPGAAHTGFQKAVNEFGGALNAVHTQATMGFRIDDFVSIFGAPPPEHIKIDVDGAEALVLAGAGSVLRSSSLKSILVELPALPGGDLPEVLRPVIDAGFTIERMDHPDGDTRLGNYILRRGA